jgi:predicted ester cyclase
VLCHHHGKHTGGNYMGIKPTGNDLNVVWFSWLRFEGDKIVHIYSISDVYSMLIDIGVIAAPQPVDPYK